MSIFKKASDLNQIPGIINDALFDKPEIQLADEFENLFKEANSSKGVYAQRVNDFKKTQTKTSYDFFETNQSESKYENGKPGIRRAGYGKRFDDEVSSMFHSTDTIRDLNSLKTAQNHELTIWDPEFDLLQNAFESSQDVEFSNKRTAMAKKESNKTKWENEHLQSIRKAKVLPHRGLGITRTGNEMPLHSEKFNNLSEFYAEAQDSIREMIRESNRQRKSSIERQGYSPEEAKSQWETKENVRARTLKNLSKASFLERFAEKIQGHDF
jgi:hypothetical protein